MVITLVLHVGISQNQMAVLPCKRELHTLGNYTLDVIASALVITQNEKKMYMLITASCSLRCKQLTKATIYDISTAHDFIISNRCRYVTLATVLLAC